MTVAVKASEANRLRQVKLMEGVPLRSGAMRLRGNPPKIDGTTPALNQRNRQPSVGFV